MSEKVKCPKCKGNLRNLGQSVEMIDSKTYEIFEAEIFSCDSCDYEVRMRINKEESE